MVWDIADLLVVVCLSCWAYSLFFCLGFERTGPTVVMIYHMVKHDIATFFIIQVTQSAVQRRLARALLEPSCAHCRLAIPTAVLHCGLIQWLATDSCSSAPRFNGPRLLVVSLPAVGLPHRLRAVLRDPCPGLRAVNNTSATPDGVHDTWPDCTNASKESSQGLVS